MENHRRKQSLLAWSGGKDAALALHKARLSGNYNVVTLITTIELPSSLSTMHRTHSSLIELQAMRIGLPLKQVFMSDNPGFEEYNAQLEETLIPYRDIGIQHIIYGDIFLEDIKNYRVNYLKQLGIQGEFPLWGMNTRDLVDEFFQAGFKAKVICVNASVLEGDFVGREFSEDFILDLPEGVDPAGENGEFHTFVYDGPIFRSPIQFRELDREFYQHPESESSSAFDTSFWYQPLILDYQ